MSDFELSAAEFRALDDLVKQATALDDVVAVCEELNRWSFLCVVTPLRLRAATGCPSRPRIATFSSA